MTMTLRLLQNSDVEASDLEQANTDQLWTEAVQALEHARAVLGQLKGRLDGDAALTVGDALDSVRHAERDVEDAERQADTVPADEDEGPICECPPMVSMIGAF